LDAYVRQLFSDDAIIGISLASFADNSNVVELIASSNTSMTTLAHCLDFAEQLRLTPTVQHNSQRLFSQSCRQAYLEEGLRMLKEGVSPALIENGGRAAGFSLGPLALADDVSLPMVQAMATVKESDSMTVIRRLSRDLKRHGKACGAGFYDYAEGGSQRLWSKLNDNYPENETQPDVDIVKKRLLSIQALTAVNFIENGIMTNEHADLVSVFCADYPSYTGGAISYIDSMGVSEFINQCNLLSDKFGLQFSCSDWLLDRPKKSYLSELNVN
jgi:3-hydroxyacyl-CoA dehydrogenase/enoyl-CoA hydratase/3-hydroxybutyryl-CoA epimerase